MSDPFLTEIRLISFNFPPKGWAFCNGQLLRINQNQALFALVGTTYGGDGQTTFGLPNLQGLVSMGMGSGYVLGQFGGTETVTLTTLQIPAHNHNLQVNSGAGTALSPVGAFPASSATNPYSASAGSVMGLTPSANAGSSQAHTNMSPYLVLNFIIALQGIFPSRN